MRSFRHPRWQHLDYRVKVATTQENKSPTQGTLQWTFTTPRWRCGSILLQFWANGDPDLSRHMVSLGPNELTHSGWDKMVAISQTTCSSAFSWIIFFEFKIKFHCIEICSLGCHIGSDNGLAQNRRQAIILTNVGMYWCQDCQPIPNHI